MTAMSWHILSTIFVLSDFFIYLFYFLFLLWDHVQSRRRQYCLVYKNTCLGSEHFFFVTAYYFLTAFFRVTAGYQEGGPFQQSFNIVCFVKLNTKQKFMTFTVCNPARIWLIFQSIHSEEIGCVRSIKRKYIRINELKLSLYLWRGYECIRCT